MGDDFHDIRKIQLKGYLREFYVKPDMSAGLWAAVNKLMGDKKTATYGIRFNDEFQMKQFCQAVLLSQGRQLNWRCEKSFAVLESNFSEGTYLSDYVDYDVLFIVHDRGTMKNSIFGQTINQVCVLRSPRKTFFFDLGGPSLSDLIFPIRSIHELGSSVPSYPRMSSDEEIF